MHTHTNINTHIRACPPPVAHVPVVAVASQFLDVNALKCHMNTCTRMCPQQEARQVTPWSILGDLPSKLPRTRDNRMYAYIHTCIGQGGRGRGPAGARQ